MEKWETESWAGPGYEASQVLHALLCDAVYMNVHNVIIDFFACISVLELLESAQRAQSNYFGTMNELEVTFLAD